jgi:hypothetical protein
VSEDSRIAERTIIARTMRSGKSRHLARARERGTGSPTLGYNLITMRVSKSTRSTFDMRARAFVKRTANVDACGKNDVPRVHGPLPPGKIYKTDLQRTLEPWSITRVRA